MNSTVDVDCFVYLPKVMSFQKTCPNDKNFFKIKIIIHV